MGARLIIVSNRVAVPETGTPLAGGMAVAVKAALKNRNGMWFGWSGKVSEEPNGEPQVVDINKMTYVLIDLSQNDIQEYYNGLANSVLWPILHYRVDLQEYSRADASGYIRVNRMFADRLSA
ncbi:MAG TPA: trehalose-6-phosphate synthase, partial [Roseiarcus sp.]|nr:trehalose-6-phosphate synthase [Roseiarcus sp.]